MAAGKGAADQVGGASFFGCAYCQEVYPERRELEVHIQMTHVDLPFCSVPAPMPERERRLLQKAPVSAISRGVPLSEVARHCTPEDCWVAIGGKVYDLTEFMDRHPGGPTSILSQAGKDATKVFNDIHKGVKIDQYLRPEALVGNLGIDEDLMTESYWHTLRKVRIEEIKEELARVSEGEALPNRQESISRLLGGKTLHKDIEARVRSLETQKRVALDFEDFAKAQAISKRVDELLALAQVPAPAAAAAAGGIPLSEVARHNKPHDCWVAVNGAVYDLTDFLAQHPEQRNAVLAWAGRDATPVWDKIPGRFPSTTWMNFYLRPEARMGEVGPEPKEDPLERQVRALREELRRLEGPSEEQIQAHRAAAAAARAAPLASQAASQLSEEARFPRLREIAAGRGELPFYTRAEVAKHSGPPGGAPGAEPWIVIHNRVYDLAKLLGNHPGGDDVLLAKAGQDATKEFELFEHSEKSRVRRDQDMLVGELVPAEHTDWAKEAQTGGLGLEGAAVGAAGRAVAAAGRESDVARYLRYKATDALLASLALYGYWSWQHRKALPKLMYSRGLRHLHLLMALGLAVTVGSAQAAAGCEGLAKKRWLQVHKQSGVAMLAAFVVRVFVRLRSGIPPRFPAHPAMQFVETLSLKLFYALMLVLPLSGVANEYYLRWAPGSEQTGHREDDERNDRLARQSFLVHTRVGKFFEYVWLPFHLGYTTAYHYSQGRGVWRKVSPFI